MEHASVITGQDLVRIGGKKTENVQENANLVVFDLQEATCTKVELSGREPSSLFNHSACYWKDNQIIVYRGQSGPNNETTSEYWNHYFLLHRAYCFSRIPSMNSIDLKAEWRAVETDSKIKRKGHTAHIYQNQMVVLGGTGRNDNNMVGIHILNLGKEKWKLQILINR